MLLKQCRVPRTFSFFSCCTNARASSTEVAGWRRSVLYSRLPAQLLGLPSHAQLVTGDSTRAVITADIILRNDRLFMPGLRHAWIPKPQRAAGKRHYPNHLSILTPSEAQAGRICFSPHCSWIRSQHLTNLHPFAPCAAVLRDLYG